MRFFGVINAAYYVVYVSDDYQECIIGHPNKNTLIMTFNQSTTFLRESIAGIERPRLRSRSIKERHTNGEVVSA